MLHPGPRRPGERVKANRRDAVALAKLLRAGELNAVWVPDEGHEAMRDLVRARSNAVETLRVHKPQVSAFMLRHGRHYPRQKAWSMRYLRWFQEQQFDHPAHQIVLQEMVEPVRLAKERVERLECTIEEFLPAWSLAAIVAAPRALRGVDLIVAATFVSEIGDIGRFNNPRQLMGYSAWCRVNARPALPCGEVASRRPAIDGSATFWSRAPSTSAKGRQAEALSPARHAAEGPRDRLEGADAADRTLLCLGWAWQADDGGVRGHRSGARRLHVVCRPRGAASMT
jgi:transposase